MLCIVSLANLDPSGRSTESNKSNGNSDIPHKRSNSKTLSSCFTHDTDEHQLISNIPLNFQAMPRYQKSDIRHSIHLTRRRRLSIQSSCASGTGACTFSNYSDFNGDEDTNKRTKPLLSSSQLNASNDIHSELQLENSTTDLPDHTIHESPELYLQKLVKVMCHGRELEVKKARSLEGFFAKVTEAQMEAYTITVVSVVRNNDLAGLKDLHAKGQVLNCFNRFGESLLHMACRRGFEDMVEFLLDQPEIDIRICDDNGRTVLHDACWNPSPQLRICQRILERDPTLFFISDNRGCSAFQYARPEHWSIWRKFLLDNKESLTALNHPDVLERLSKAP